MPTRLAYLGPTGTYGEQAARALVQLEAMGDVQFVPCVGLRAVVEQLAIGTCDAAVVPIENSVEGGGDGHLGCVVVASRPVYSSRSGVAHSSCTVGPRGFVRNK